MLKMNLNDRTIRKAIWVMAFYTIAIPSAFVLYTLYPGGPCNPGLAVLIFILLLPANIVMLLVSLYKTFKIDQSYAILTFIHAIACTVFFVL